MSLPFPEIACAYEVYDPATLEPQNESTFIRLMELGWSREDFEGRTVFDVGCNTGALSVYACRLGAARVFATDVQAPLVDFTRSVVESHNLPVTVERRGFFQIDPKEGQADVLLLMEVLHWLVDQGHSVEDSIAHAAALTKETLFFETPWDVNEPSIAHKGKIKEDQYNIELIFRELSRHFREVEIIRFMTYFGQMKDSKRVLIRARRPRAVSLPVGRDMNPLDVSLSRGGNPSELVTTTQGPKVLKALAGGAFSALPDRQFEQFCDYIRSIKGPTLVPPEKIGGRYRRVGADGKTYMLFPFVGKLGDYFPEKRTPQAARDHLALAVGVTRDMRGVPSSVLTALKQNCRPVSAASSNFITQSVADDVQAFCLSVAGRLRNYDRNQEDSVIHSDMQLGNFVVDQSGQARVVDVDTVRTGPAYADILCSAIYNGATRNELNDALEQVERVVGRRCRQFDIDFSVGLVLGWYEAIVTGRMDISERARTLFQNGLKLMAEISS